MVKLSVYLNRHVFVMNTAFPSLFIYFILFHIAIEPSSWAVTSKCRKSHEAIIKRPGDVTLTVYNCIWHIIWPFSVWLLPCLLKASDIIKNLSVAILDTIEAKHKQIVQDTSTVLHVQQKHMCLVRLWVFGQIGLNRISQYSDRLVWTNSVDPDQTPQNAASG